MDRSQRIQEIVKNCLQRWGRGEAVDLVALVDKHPDLAPELEMELQKVRLIGQAAQGKPDPQDTQAAPSPALPRGGLRVRCPHCRNAMEVLENSTDLLCESCGGGIHFCEDSEASRQKQLGHFQLEALLGTGAFGSVWKARDQELDRDVAIKIPRGSQLDASQSEQFLREARIAAQLDHPHIVRVHEIGRDQGTTFIVSDLVSGKPLSQWMQDQTLTVREIANLCETLADALHHAHRTGIVHRDLKPANIMMDADNAPRIMDFGLAKRNVGELTMTADGQVLGTPAYMSPEQARGDSHHVDGRSDIYSLGVILFELLTNELPFRGGARMMIEQVVHDEPPSPRRLAEHVPRDLETICLKCLGKAQSSRYASAQLLADELRRFQRGEPILARPVSPLERSWRWCQRFPAAAIALGLTAFLAIAGPAFAWHERSLRQDLDTRYQERAAMIGDLQSKREELAHEVTRLRASVRDQAATRPALQVLAHVAAEHYGAEPPREMRLERLLGTGIILDADNQTRAAIDVLEQARLRLQEQSEHGDDRRLALADCCVRLSRLYRGTDQDKAVERAEEAQQIVADVMQSSPSLAAFALHGQAISGLSTALSTAGDSARATQVLLAAANFEPELRALLPESDKAIYQLASDFFAELPPLLASQDDAPN